MRPIFRFINFDFYSRLKLTHPSADRSGGAPFPLLFSPELTDVASSAGPDCRGAASLATTVCFHFRSPAAAGLERLAQELNAATWRTRTGSLLPFNILASPLAAAARGIDMRSGFRLLAPLRSARHCTTLHGTERHCTERHGTCCSHASLRQAGLSASGSAV